MMYQEKRMELEAELARTGSRVLGSATFKPSEIRLVKAEHGKPCQHGATYIGREFGGHRCSPLANDFKVRDFAHKSQAMGAFMRQLAERVAAGHEVVQHMAKLESGSRLACWCTSRPAVLLWSAAGLPDDACHGDALASMHEALVTEGYWTGGRGRGFLSSAAMIFGRAFGPHRLLRARMRRETDAWLRAQGREGLPALEADGTRARACDECNGRGFGCKACDATGFAKS